MFALILASVVLIFGVLYPYPGLSIDPAAVSTIEKESDQTCISVVAPEKVAFNWPPPPRETENDYFIIAENGQARSCIVVPVNLKSEEHNAAQMVQIYLELVTGAKFVRFKENEKMPSDLARIHVGETEKAKQVAFALPPVNYGGIKLPNINGYIVKTLDSKNLILLGATPRATIFAVVGLLKRYAGVRRYWPGEPGGIGDVVLHRPELKLPRMEWHDWPYFISTAMFGLDNRGPQSEIGKKVRLADFWRMHQTIQSNESYYRLMEAREHADQVELFPLLQSKRFVPKYEPNRPDPHGWQPCVSNPRVAEIMAESIKNNFRQDPLLIGEALSVNDGWGDCRCSECSAMDQPGTDINNRIGLCDRYIKFDNRVADLVEKDFPERVLAFLAYGSMSSPPRAVSLHRMLLPVLCMNQGNSYAMWDRWSKSGAKLMGMYQYRDGAGFVLPKINMHHTAKQLRYFVGSGKACLLYHPITCIYPLDGMVGYIQAEMTWDPRINEDDLLSEYYDKFYQKAAKPMKSFYETLEAAHEEWLNRVGYPHPYGKDIPPNTGIHSQSQFEVLPKASALKAQEYLKAALKAAENDNLVRARVQLVKTIFDFVVLGTMEYWAGKRVQNNPARNMEDAERALTDAREAIDNGLRFSAYKVRVMEKVPIKVYADHALPGSDFDRFYNDIQAGSVHPMTFGSICRGFRTVSAFLRASLGPEKAAVWWKDQQRAETRPFLKTLINLAISMARGDTLDNLVEDPSFELRGEDSTPKTQVSVVKNGIAREAQIQQRLQVGGSLYNCSFSKEEVHSGKYSVVFWDSQSGWIGEKVYPKEGEVLRISVWVKQIGNMNGFLEVSARNDLGKITEIVEPVQNKSGWQQVEVFFPVPAGTTYVFPALVIREQSPEAKAWVDDFFVYKYGDFSYHHIHPGTQ